MPQTVLYKTAENPHGEAWRRAAERAGHTYREVPDYCTALLDLWKSDAPQGVLVSRDVAPIRAAAGMPPSLPEPQAVIAREEIHTGWVNQYDFCGGAWGRRIYPRGFPYSRRHAPHEYQAVDQTAAPPPLAFYSYVIGGAGGGDMCSACCLVLPCVHEKLRFPEDPRVTGALVGRRSWSALSGVACVIARDAVPYWPVTALGGPLADVVAGYVLQMVTRGAGLWVGFGSVLPREGKDRHVTYDRLRDEAAAHEIVERMVDAIDDYHAPEGEGTTDRAFEATLAWLRTRGCGDVADAAETWRVYVRNVT